MIINKAYKYRIYPNKEQTRQLKQCGGNTRFLWNYFWNMQKEYYLENKKYLSAYDLNNLLPSLKKQEELQFLNNSYSQSLCCVSSNLSKAINKSFFKEIKTERNKAISKAMFEANEYLKNKKLVKAYNLGFPNFKKKSDYNDSFCIQSGFKIGRFRIFISKVGLLEYKQHRNYEGIPKSITISQDGNKYYLSICCELEIQDQEIKTDNIIGIDLGLKEFAVFSDGEIISNPKIYRKLENKVKREQKILTRRQKKSKRRKNSTIKVEKNTHKDKK